MPWDVLSIDKALYVSTDAAVRKIENNTVSTVAGTRVSSELRTPTAIAVSGDYAYVGLAGSNGLGRVELASGVFEQLRAYDETDFPIYYIFAMTAVDSTLYLMSESALFAYDIPTGKTTKLWDLMPATFSPGCLVADGDNLYFGGLDLSVDPYAYKLLKLPRAGGNASVVVRSEAIRVSGNAVLHDGALYLANAKQVSRIDLQTSQVTTAAGGAQGGCAAGVGENARFGQITGITSDGKYVYLGDRGCHTLWRMDPKSQLVEHVAGDKANATFAGGLGREAGLNDPTDIAYDAASKSLIICDSFDNIVYRAAAPTAP